MPRHPSSSGTHRSIGLSGGGELVSDSRWLEHGDAGSTREPNLDPVHDALERLEWHDAKREETPHSRLAAFTRRAALTGGAGGGVAAGGAAGLVATALAACGGSDSSSSAQSGGGGGTPASGIFKTSKKMKFVFVNHVTTNPFFVPTRYGAADACKLLGCPFQGAGFGNRNVNQMVNAFNTSVTGG